MTVAGLRRMLAALTPEFNDAPVMLQQGQGWTPAAAFYLDPADEHNDGRPSVGFMPATPDENVQWFELRRKDGAT